MRCNNTRCHYNDDCFCRQPDYVVIDEKGECSQMLVNKMTVTERYKKLRGIADEAYKIFDSNPTQANSDAYGMTLNNLRDFCVEVIASMVKERPDLSDSIWWEEE